MKAASVFLYMTMYKEGGKADFFERTTVILCLMQP